MTSRHPHKHAHNKDKNSHKHRHKHVHIEKDEHDGDGNDNLSIGLLLLLYTLQGIPLGLSGSIPFLLQGKVGYTDQATFSLVSWPFSLKLLWAPLVDSVYNKRFGRRKSWLVPVQLIVSALMLGGSSFVEEMLGDENNKPKTLPLTAFFFVLYFMMATQDIAVDGWALTMLSRKNVSYASTCNTVGQTLGYFAAYVGFLALNDPATCNSYLRWEPSDKGLVSLGGFMSFWGWIMLFTTLGVWFFKRERPEKAEHIMGIRETYHQLYRILQLPSVIYLTIFLLTCKIGFSAAETVAPLKIVEYGLAKEKLALMTPLLVPLGVVIPLYLSKYSKGDNALDLFMKGYPFRLLIGLLYAAVVWYTKVAVAAEGGLPYSYYAALLVSSILHSIATNMMFVSVMAFFANISDPAIGGTYMTYLNTITNLGSKWPNSLSLYFIDYLTFKQCMSSAGNFIPDMQCNSTATTQQCTDANGTCAIVWDGFFIEIAICFALGVIWFILCSKKMLDLQALDAEYWRVKRE